MVEQPDFAYVDADNHFYEAPDAFTRHAGEAVKRYVQWFEQGKKRRLLLGGEFIGGTGNPTFNPVAKPGAFHETLKSLEQGEVPEGPRYGDLAPLDPGFMYREQRLDRMDEQNLERMFIYPTIGLSIEHQLSKDWGMMYAVYHAFNQWVDDDWGFNYQNRIYSPPVIAMADIDRTVRELEWALERGARIITMTPGPCYGRSPADSYFDPFWQRVNDSGVFVVYHSYGGIPTAYQNAYNEMWAREPLTSAMHTAMLRGALLPFHKPIMDTMIALVLGGLFNRFPKIKVASVEVGAAWVPYCLHELDHAGSNLVERRVQTFDGELVGFPSDVFKQHVYVSPFPEEDVEALAGLIGPDKVLFGSDWPHPEGVANPADFRKYVAGLPDDQQRMIMRDNALAAIGE
jgi:predicted TIM-barrel fold metal-dependent hydrolase